MSDDPSDVDALGRHNVNSVIAADDARLAAVIDATTELRTKISGVSGRTRVVGLKPSTAKVLLAYLDSLDLAKYDQRPK